jgi:16S rRNA (guanine1516-N2)-methyltransferase
MTLPFDLIQTPDGLQIIETSTGLRLAIDFVSGALDFRRRFGGRGGQMVLKAVGGPKSRNGEVRRVLDATAGLGRDAFILATGGCRVTAVEKNALLFSVLQDALKRAENHEPTAKALGGRLTFLQGDVTQGLGEKMESFDSVYLDPMFPQRKKTALVKKEMQVLQRLVGDPIESSSELFEAAQKLACERTVVKRPSGAPAIKEPVSLVLKDPSIRFDVYVKN